MRALTSSAFFTSAVYGALTDVFHQVYLLSDRTMVAIIAWLFWLVTCCVATLASWTFKFPLFYTLFLTYSQGLSLKF